MPKMKTHSSAKKRFTITGSGKIKRNKACKGHLLTKKKKKECSGSKDRKSIIVQDDDEGNKAAMELEMANTQPK